MPNKTSRGQAALFLLAVTFLWGTTFLIMQRTLAYTGPVSLIATRFIFAALMLVPLLGRQVLAVTRRELVGGVIVGGLILLSYTLQCMGLKSVASSLSALLTALYVPFTFLVGFAIAGKVPRAWNVIGAAVTLVGLVFLVNPLTITWENNIGEWLTILCAFVCACSIYATGIYAPGSAPLRLVFVEMVTVALGGSLWWALSGEGVPAMRLGYWEGILSLAAIAAFSQYGCNRVQALVPADEASLLYALEPLFAALIGYWAGERFGLWQGIGASLMLAGIFVSQGWPYLRARIATGS